jgi:deoxyribose-phosphate aldolase
MKTTSETSTKPRTADEIVGLFDHAILQPTLTDEEMIQQVNALRPYPIASVCIKPHAVALACQALKGTRIAVGTVIGFPHGSALPEIKAFEAERAFDDGAIDVDMVVNIGKVLGGDWDYVRRDIDAVLAVTRRVSGRVIKVIFETDFLTQDEHKIRLCQICSDLGVDYVKTSTGFGFVKRSDGSFGYTGATAHDIALMRKHSASKVGIKPSGGVRTLDDALKFIELGATRIGTTATASIHAEAVKRFGC